MLGTDMNQVRSGTEGGPSSTSTSVDVDEAVSLAKQYMDSSLMSRAKRLQQDKHDVIRAFQGADKDVVALLTHRIRSLETHFKQHRHDHHSMRGLQALVQQRRRSLQYLRRTDFTNYSILLHKLGLKDAYSSTHRLDKYKTGTRLPYPTEPIKLYKQKKKLTK